MYVLPLQPNVCAHLAGVKWKPIIRSSGRNKSVRQDEMINKSFDPAWWLSGKPFYLYTEDFHTRHVASGRSYGLKTHAKWMRWTCSAVVTPKRRDKLKTLFVCFCNVCNSITDKLTSSWVITQSVHPSRFVLQMGSGTGYNGCLLCEHLWVVTRFQILTSVSLVLLVRPRFTKQILSLCLITVLINILKNSRSKKVISKQKTVNVFRRTFRIVTLSGILFVSWSKPETADQIAHTKTASVIVCLHLSLFRM